jgi:hypothetical protein
MKADSEQAHETDIDPNLLAQLAPVKKKLRRVERAVNVYAFPSLLFILLFTLPVIGNIAAPTVGTWMGCSFGENEARHCPVFGSELAEIFYEYAVSILVGGILNPIYFFRAMSIILTPVVTTIWIGSVVWLYARRYNLRRELWVIRLLFGRRFS